MYLFIITLTGYIIIKLLIKRKMRIIPAKTGKKLQSLLVKTLATVEDEGPKILKVSKIDCLRFLMCPLLVLVLIGFFSSCFAVAINSNNEANKAGGTCH
jgi:hypothetical protein